MANFDSYTIEVSVRAARWFDRIVFPETDRLWRAVVRAPDGTVVNDSGFCCLSEATAWGSARYYADLHAKQANAELAPRDETLVGRSPYRPRS